jgi:hypothetical protein
MRNTFLTLLSLTVIATSKPISAGHSSATSRDTDGATWSKLTNTPRSEMPYLDAQKRADTTWNPPSQLVTPLQQVWDHEMSTYSNPLGFKNYGFDQIMANKGYVHK